MTNGATATGTTATGLAAIGTTAIDNLVHSEIISILGT